MRTVSQKYSQYPSLAEQMEVRTVADLQMQSLFQRDSHGDDAGASGPVSVAYHHANSGKAAHIILDMYVFIH